MAISTKVDSSVAETLPSPPADETISTVSALGDQRAIANIEPSRRR